MNETNDSNKAICARPKQRKGNSLSRSVLRGVPPEIENSFELKRAMEILPKNYNFEIPKTIWRIQQKNAKIVILQCPEGLFKFVTKVSNIIEIFTDAETVIIGAVTYGACCVDDTLAKPYNADLMVHYGHSCLIPIDQTDSISCLYVFVDIQFDALYLLEKIRCLFPTTQPLALVSIIQFVGSLQTIASELKNNGYDVVIPQSKPLSPGEILGCTSAPVPKGYTIICLGDGRFHLESIMISNPEVETYLYNPYSKVMSREYYDQPMMKQIRKAEIDKASRAEFWGIINGTLGRQGSTKVLENLEMQLKKSGKQYILTSSPEILQDSLESLSKVGTWVQIACPRLSIDWGVSFKTPLLNPYEASVALKGVTWNELCYPMDYYAYDSAGPWTPNHKAQCGSTKKKKFESTIGCCVNNN